MASAKPKNSKLIIFVLAALVLGAAGFGYFRQAAKLDNDSASTAPAVAPAKIDATLLALRPNDIIMGDANALVTIVEYSSLSCPHCGHFHQEILPIIEKEFITPGKVKLVIRHFPLNEPAIKAAELVECAGKNGQKRENFMKVLFSMQQQWAFGEDFLKNLKQISLVGGVDSAAFDSCMADKDAETAILAGRQEAETKLQVAATPTFFINGGKFEGEVSADGFRDALRKAGGGK